MNIILIVIDALRAENVSCYGYSKKTTPTIDNLATGGILFERAYACTDQTDPSFTTIFSGKYPITHGVLHQGLDVKNSELYIINHTEKMFIPEVLKDYDYYNIGISWLRRWHMRGYDYYSNSNGADTGCDKLTTKAYRKMTSLLERLLTVSQINMPIILCALASKVREFIGITTFAYTAPKDTELAIKMLESVKNKNFFLLLHYIDVHTPHYNLPTVFTKKFYEKRSNVTINEMLKKIKSKACRRTAIRVHLHKMKYVDEIIAKYDGAINYVDYAIGQLIRYIEEQNMLDRTLIIVTADHGDNLLRNGIFVSHIGLYEHVVHVPLILYGAGLPTGRRIKNIVQHIDIFPTILGLLNIDSNEYNCDGQSLCSLIYSSGSNWRSEGYFISSACEKRVGIVTNRYKYIYSPSETARMDKYNGLWSSSVVELYDLKKDPYETRNIILDKPEIAEKLKCKLLNWLETLEIKKLKILSLYKTIKQLRTHKKIMNIIS